MNQAEHTTKGPGRRTVLGAGAGIFFLASGGGLALLSRPDVSMYHQLHEDTRREFLKADPQRLLTAEEYLASMEQMPLPTNRRLLTFDHVTEYPTPNTPTVLEWLGSDEANHLKGVLFATGEELDKISLSNRQILERLIQSGNWSLGLHGYKHEVYPDKKSLLDDFKAGKVQIDRFYERMNEALPVDQRRIPAPIAAFPGTNISNNPIPFFPSNGRISGYDFENELEELGCKIVFQSSSNPVAKFYGVINPAVQPRTVGS